MNPLSIHISDINKLCYHHNVKHLYVFGSALTNNFNPESDIDFIVEFLPVNPKEYADNYYGLKFSLEKVLNRKIDLLEEPAIKNPYFFQSIQLKKQIVYGNWSYTWLFYVLNAIEEIDSFFINKPMEFEAYQNDLRTRRAVERNIEIIGEALNRILSKQPEINISFSRKL